MTNNKSLSLITLLLFLFLTCAHAGSRWRWRETTPQSGPVPQGRSYGSAIFDEAGNRVILFGGRGAQGFLNDLWSFDLDSGQWSELQPAEPLPAPRHGHNAVYDPVGRQMIVWAGQGNGLFNDVWALDLSADSWSELTPAAGPASRYGAAAVYDPQRRSLVQFGGFTSLSGRFNDTQAFDIAAPGWEDLSPPSGRPASRCLHTAAYRPSSQTLVMFGGQISGHLSDLWAFDLSDNQWERLNPPTSPPGRWMTSSFVDSEGGFLVFAGNTEETPSGNDLWRYDFDANSWAEVDAASPPPGRSGPQTASLGPNQFFVFSGLGSGEYLTDAWLLEKEEEFESWFAQLANGSGFVSIVVLINPSSTMAVSGELEAFDDDGAPMQLSFNGQGPQAATAFALPPLGSAAFATDGQGEARSGSARVRSDGRLGAFLRFFYPDVGIGGVQASPPLNGFITPALRDDRSSTGIAVASTGEPVQLRINLLNADGSAAAAEVQMQLPANGHLALFIEQLFPDIGQFQGSLTVTSEGGTIIATAIQFGDAPGLFTTLPVTELD